jgi:hypothetical protein
MQTSQPPQSERPVVNVLDDPYSLEVFATGASGFSVLGPNISITLETVRANHTTQPPSVNRVVVGRLLMSAPDLVRFSFALSEFLRSQGLDPNQMSAV